MKSKVVILKTNPSRVLEDYSKLMELAEIKKIFNKKDEILLKLNLSWSLYFPACSTEPWQLEGVLKKLTDEGYTKLLPLENKTVVTKPWKGAELNKWLPVLERYKQRFISLPEVEWVKYRAKSEMEALYEIFPEGIEIPKMFFGKKIIHMPTMKTHGHTTVTGAIKNAFGGLINEKRHHCHKRIHEILVDLLKIQKEIHPKILAVMDGTVCGSGAGPRTMVPKIKNYILASEDQVAIDAVSAKMMGFDPLKINFLSMSHDKGLGCADIRQIDIIGEKIDNVNFNFNTSRSPVVFFDQFFRKGALNKLEPLLFHTPLFNACIFASAFYHDYLWYNIWGRKIIKKFMETEWGQLFSNY